MKKFLILLWDFHVKNFAFAILYYHLIYSPTTFFSSFGFVFRLSPERWDLPLFFLGKRHETCLRSNTILTEIENERSRVDASEIYLLSPCSKSRHEDVTFIENCVLRGSFYLNMFSNFNNTFRDDCETINIHVR